MNDTHTLDWSKEEFSDLIDKGKALVMGHHEDYDDLKGYNGLAQKEMEALFDEPLPMEGMSYEAILNEVKEKVFRTATGNLGPHMYAYVMSGGNQLSIVADMLASTINQNTGKWHLSPGVSEMEKRVVRWGAEMLGLDDFHGGILVSGGSGANLAGLTVARNIFFEKENIRKTGLFGRKPFTVYSSIEVHGCVDKSIEILGIGTNHLRKVRVNEDYTMNLEALIDQIESDIEAGFQPFCVVGNAGTVNTGAIDDMNRIADICLKYNMWFHVDGAYGGLAGSLDSIRNKYAGMHRANSVAIDFHKWLYQPFEVGCLLVRDWTTLRNAYFKKADYLDTSLEQQGRVDFNEHMFQLSRNNKALKVWMSYKTYGTTRIKQMIQKDIDLSAYLADQVKNTNDFILKARSDLAIACFQFKGDLTDPNDIIALNQKLIPALEEDGRVFITGTKLKGEFVLRACLINHRKTKATTDYLLEVIRDVGNKILTN